MAKLELPKIKTETSGVLKEYSFGIGNEGLIFEILRKQLYTNPILSCVREISINARDSHHSVNKEKTPIHITLPTWSDLTFKIQDFGSGIAPDVIENVFVNYGSSTKRNDDNQVGYFGIGSKSWGAYCDSVTVISITEGIKRTYQAYIDESRKGKLDLIQEVKTTESNGTSIIIPVKKSDVEKFKTAITTVSQFWDVRPKVSNGPLSYDNYKLVQTGTNWAIYDHIGYNSYYGTNSGTFAIISGLKYEINRDEFDTEYQEILANPFILYFGNSELSLSASRDSLHIDTKTKKAIKAKLDSVFKEFADRVSGSIKTAKTYPEAIKKYNETVNILMGNKNLLKKLPPVEWNGHAVISQPTLQLILPEIKYTIYRWDDYKYNKYKKNGNKDGYPIFAQTANAYNIPSFLGETNIFYHADINITSTVRDYVNEIFTANEAYKKKNIIVVYTPEEMEDVNGKTYKPKYNMQYLDLFNVPKISTITLPAKEKKVRSKYKTNNDVVSVYKLRKAYYYSSTIQSESVQEVPNTGGVYVIYDYEKRTIKDENNPNIKNIPMNNIDQFLGQEVWGITETRAKKLSKDWKTLTQAIDDRIEALYKEITHDELVKIVKNMPHITNPSSYVVAAFVAKLDASDLKSLGDNSIVKYSNLAKDIGTKNKKYGDFISFLAEYKGDKSLKTDPYGYTKDGAELKILSDQIIRDYPLLAALGSNSANYKTGILDYIQYKDKTLLAANKK